MVNPFIKRIIVMVVTTVTKSAMKAYENTIKSILSSALNFNLNLFV